MSDSSLPPAAVAELKRAGKQHDSIQRAEQLLVNAKTPQETKAIEEYSAAARAYAKEQNDYEAMVTATRIYLLARRKTTELILPEIKQGGSNNRVTLYDFGFTKMQWHRRVMELQIEQEKLNEYFDDCISKGWNPSIAGVLKYADGKHEPDAPPVMCTCSHCGNEHRKFVP